MIKVFTIIKDKSERIPKKNFQILNGKELWKNLIEELSGLDIYINTDSEDVIRELNSKEKYKHITCINRKKKHIEWEDNPKIRNSPVEDMFNDFATDYCDDEDIIVLTHVTSPFLRKQTLLDAIKLVEENKYEYVHSVKMIKDFAWLKQKKSFQEINFDSSIVQLTQDLDPIIISLGAFFIMRKKTLDKNNGRRLGKNTFFYNLSEIESIEIDNPEQLQFARMLNTLK